MAPDNNTAKAGAFGFLWYGLPALLIASGVVCGVAYFPPQLVTYIPHIVSGRGGDSRVDANHRLHRANHLA